MKEHSVTAGPYMIELPANGVAILYEADESGAYRQLPGGSGYLEALVQFAGEVIRLCAMIDQMQDERGDDGRATIAVELLEALTSLVSQIDKNDFRDGLGHDAKMLKAFVDAKSILVKVRGVAP
ncbi:MAG: hypothetical protein WC026_17080 [Hyphomicrobium sp.]|uniref:hypothetical protein n=1 Tax=Hyphomicrobium sp. TaxID=82 RepID=UPI003563557B